MRGSDSYLKAGQAALSDQMPFLIAAAHELKSPLSLIRQLSLQLEKGDVEQIEAQRILKQITLTSERGLRLTSDLTRSTRLEDGLFEMEPVNSRQLCEDVAHELTPLYRARGRDIRVSSSRKQNLVVANKELLRRILINFADNALHYTDTSAPVILRASSVSSGDRVKMSVRDFGPAVPGDVWRRLRKNVGKAPVALQNRPASSGIGLYVSGMFAEAMQGKIGVSRHHDGATFYVELLASKQLSLL